ncbi:MAG: lysine-2,3-aminomutase-like protein [Alphaproteobacteria bacterium]|nr:lysine-2,3-aminomutase-like protein [Alphaproteobacteria bacterium]
MSQSARPRPRAIRRAADLVSAGLLDEGRAALVDRVAERFALAITPDMVALFEPGEPDDPIARQFVPSAAELDEAPGERADPIGDDALSPVPGIVHRYPDRVLLKPLLACPVHCRFCFRREALGDGGALSPGQLEAALDYIRARPEVWEVILSGGDPLMLPPARLSAIMDALEAIPHVQVVRIHSRIPAVEPSRVDAAMVAALRRSKAVWLVLHANHPREMTEACRAACARLVDGGVAMLGQTVLLAGVNDDAAVLEALFRAMVATRVKPYYLHHGDLVRGTAHFRTGLDEGRGLVKSLRGRVSGLCQPTYVLDIPGGHGKVPIGPDHLRDGLVEDWRGDRHPYPPVA